MAAPNRDSRCFETFISAEPLAGEGILELFTRLSVTLNELEASIVHLMVFGSIDAAAAGTEAMRRVFGRLDWPVTWVEGAACDGRPIAGVQVFALSGGPIEHIELDGQVMGSTFVSGAARQCVLGGLGPGHLFRPRAQQTQETLERLQHALGQAQFELADVVRTWFFLDGMFSWYDEFNRERTRLYSRVKFRSGSVPASTGVGGRNLGGGALTAAAWAIAPLNSTTRAKEVPSPLQCPAPAYGSSFSRGMEISTPTGRRLLISGTASIALGGQTAWRGDIRKQIALTMEVVESILRSRGFDLSELTRATAYFKHRSDAGFFTDWCAARHLDSLPVVAAQCEVCREELLFELEADAWRGGAF